VRTALYNCLFARRHGGAFILRIEDTDSARFVPGAEAYILEALQWLGLTPDEPIVRQSDRKDIYRQYVGQLIADGHAYYAFDTPDELEAARRAAPNFQYDASSRLRLRNGLTLGEAEACRLVADGHPHVVRLRIEPGHTLTVHDLIRGDVTVQTDVLDDKVLWKSADQMPTYHLANVVDDHLMGITHVIRGEEWLPSAPLHHLLYEALGWADTRPAFAHLSLLLKPEGNGKLSKRDGDRLGFPVYPLNWTDPQSGQLAVGYRESGYLPDALINFLALLGWSPGDDRELLSFDELVAAFDLTRCSRSGAKFDPEKAKWFNHQYLQRLPDDTLAGTLAGILRKKGLVPPEAATLRRIVALTKERLHLTTDLWDATDYFFVAPTAYDAKTLRKRTTPDTPAELSDLARYLSDADIAAPDADDALKAWIAARGYHAGNLLTTLRLALVGQGKGPHLFDIIAILGKTETIKRIESCTASLSASIPS
jgi:glutamyl-tRNA synthetase